MYRYHQVLYRRLLRSQPLEDLRRLRAQSESFPKLAVLIDEELVRRSAPAAKRASAFSARPLVAGGGAWSRS